MKLSHSRIEQFNNCPYKYKLHYIDKIDTISDDKPDNALFLGAALHTGLEKDLNTAIKEYYDNYPIITNDHVNEAIKLEYLISRLKPLLPQGENEVKIEDDDFVGYIDLLYPARTEQRLNGEHQIIPNLYDMIDFKYSNNSKYKDSPQLSIYKYFFEKNNPGKKIRNMYYLMVPKVTIKQKKSEDLTQFRKRIMRELEKSEVKIIQADYEPEKVIKFLLDSKTVIESTEFKQNPCWLCRFCEYNDYCKKGENYMLLPSTERRTIGEIKRRKIWIYGPSFSGKTTMLDDAPNPLNLNTDGNIQFVTMPYTPIKDEVKTVGRMTERKFAWEIFKETIAELEKKENDFKTIIVDLLEDTREMCRIFKYDELGIQHESDSGYGKGWDIIKTEYLSTMRRFFNLDYENLIVVSHEDISKDITKKNGQNITRIAPNIQEAIANKIAGMVDIVARVVVEDDDTRTLNFKSNEVIFGGGRLHGVKETSIPLSWDALCEVYDEANELACKSAPEPVQEPTPVEEPQVVEPEPEPVQEEPEPVQTEPEETTEDKPKTRVRKRR